MVSTRVNVMVMVSVRAEVRVMKLVDSYDKDK